VDQRSAVLKISSTDPMTNIPMPTPTTYEVILRYYVEIFPFVSPQLLPILTQFSPDEQAKAEMLQLGNGKEAFHNAVLRYCLNGVQMMTNIYGGSPWAAVSFSFVLETFDRIIPCYYLISSSSKLYPTLPLSSQLARMKREEKSFTVMKNYLLEFQSKIGGPHPHPDGVEYTIESPETNTTRTYPTQQFYNFHLNNVNSSSWSVLEPASLP
jgi:NADPH-ferrihemoprotein reductase